MKVSFLADVNVDERIVSGVLRAEPSISFLTAAEAGLHGLPDPKVLEIAAEEGKGSCHSRSKDDAVCFWGIHCQAS
jgi:hypothetical protein